MSADLFFVLVLTTSSLAVLVLLFLPGVELAKDINRVLALYLLVADELTMV